MNKPVSIIGASLVIISIILTFIDSTLGWWQWHVVVDIPIIGGEETRFLSAFGIINSNDSNVEPVAIDNQVSIIICTVVMLLGSFLVIFGGVSEKNILAVIGSIIIVLGLIYFLYSLSNVEEIVNMTVNIWDDQNIYFGTGSGFLNDDYSWRLGNGFFITLAGTITTAIGAFLKEK